jgi:hypothetical protein
MEKQVCNRIIIITFGLFKKSNSPSFASLIMGYYTFTVFTYNKDKTAMNKECWYLGKATTSLAYAANSVEDKKLVESYLKILLTDVCTQDTYIYCETPMLRKNKSGNLYYGNRVVQPSNHPAAWIYMTAELLYGNTHPELYK